MRIPRALPLLLAGVLVLAADVAVRASPPVPLVAVAANAAISACLNNTAPSTGPSSAYQLDVASSDQLQQAIDTYHVVSLAAGSYLTNPHTGAANPTLTLTSGDELFGVAGATSVPDMVVAAGSSGVLLSGLQANNLTFATSNTPITQSCFTRLSSPGADINITGSATDLDSNVFLGDNAEIGFDDSAGGAITNNRFIGITSGGSLRPSLVLKGLSDQSSGNNVFVDYTLATPVGDGIYASNQSALTFAGMTATNWNQRGLATHALVQVVGGGSVNLIDVHGSTGYADSALYPTFDLGAQAVNMDDVDLASRSGPQLVFENTNTQSSLINAPYTPTDYASGALRATLSSRVALNGRDASSATGTTLANLQTALLPVSSGSQWEAATFDTVPDPAGATWNASLSTRTDSSGYIQQLINTQGVAKLPAGIYYISHPLVIQGWHGLIGAGDGATAIISTDPNMDMIVGNDIASCPQPASPNTLTCTTHITLADLTLYGGANGLSLTSAGSGPNTRYAGDFISHVTFRNMSNAGINLSSIAGFDDNYLDNVNFVNDAAGVMQRSSGWDQVHARASAEFSGNVFYHSQFLSGQLGWNLAPVKVNANDACIACYFRDNTAGAVNTVNSSQFLFALSQFYNDGGTANVQNTLYPVTLLQDEFVGGPLSHAFVGGYGFNAVSSVFSQYCANGAFVTASNTRQLTLINANTAIPVGFPAYGTYLNSLLSADTTLDNVGVLASGGTSTTFIAGTPTPVAWPLVGSVYTVI